MCVMVACVGPEIMSKMAGESESNLRKGQFLRHLCYMHVYVYSMVWVFYYHGRNVQGSIFLEVCVCVCVLCVCMCVCVPFSYSGMSPTM